MDRNTYFNFVKVLCENIVWKSKMKMKCILYGSVYYILSHISNNGDWLIKRSSTCFIGVKQITIICYIVSWMKICRICIIASLFYSLRDDNFICGANLFCLVLCITRGPKLPPDNFTFIWPLNLFLDGFQHGPRDYLLSDWICNCISI